MKEKEIIEGNDLICEFMNNQEEPRYRGIKGSYHKSWNELMLVIKEISRRVYYQESGLFENLEEDDALNEEGYNLWEEFLNEVKLDSLIKNVYGKVVKFIKWYIKNK